MIIETDERDADLRSVNLLLTLIRFHVTSAGAVELYPIWDLEEHKPPLGTIEMTMDSLQADEFFLHEQFLHRATRSAES